MYSRCFMTTLLATLALGLLVTCAGPTPPPTATPPPLAKELVLYNWPEYIPQAVLDAFTTEYGVKITYLTYDSQEEAVEKIKAGLTYDVAVIENDLLQSLIKEGLLAEIDYRQVPNFRNVVADFRDLTFDPSNRHSAPYTWGTTGLLVRSDLVESPVTRWADLWDQRYAGKIAVRAQPTELISVALKSLGYPLNSEDPQALEAALQRLIDLKSSVMFVDVEVEKAVTPLVSGAAVILVGWPEDALYARDQNAAIRYVLPEEGSMLWSDSFVISANSPHKATAELFLNFVLRPDIGGQIVNETHYAIANEAARAFIKPEIAGDTTFYPPKEIIQRANWYLPLSPAGQKLYDDIWERFMTAGK